MAEYSIHVFSPCCHQQYKLLLWKMYTAMAEGSIARPLCSYWKKKSSQEDLLKVAAKVDQDAWRAQADAGIDLVGLDGTLYDQACALPKLAPFSAL